MAPSAIGAALNNVPTPWAVVFAGAIGSITYDLSTFCTQDPPADPGMTTLDWISLINPLTLADSVLAKSKFRDWLGHYLWDTFCQCDSGMVPTPYTPPTAPTDLPQINPPAAGPSYPTGGACGQDTFTAGPLSSGVFHQEPLRPIGDITYFVVDYNPHIALTTTGQTGFAVTFYNAAGTDLGSAVSCGISTSTLTAHAAGAPPAGTTQYRFQWATTGTVTPAVTMTANIAEYCGTTTPGGNGGPVPQPCPTDTFTQLQLDQLLQLVTLIQRQVAPFGYIAGTTHSGLSGDGSLSVQGLLGAKVSVVDGGYEQGVESGDPDAIWNVGWVNWGNADGYSERQWIGTSEFLTLPALAGQYTHLNYSLKPGVQVDITELEREP